MLPSAQRILSVASYREQAKAWWFNTELITLVPDADDSFIYLPSDVIRVDPTDQGLNYVQRGNRLYRAYGDDSSDRYAFSAPVQCWLVRSLAFDDLPVHGKLLIEAATLWDFQKEYDADNSKAASLEKAYARALIEIGTEHIRNKGANFLKRSGVVSKFNAIAPAGQYGRLPTPFSRV